MEFVRDPYPWQRELLDRACRADQFAALAEVGTGKTFGIINVLRLKVATLLAREQTPRILILSPAVTLGNWARELKEYSFPDDLPATYCLDRPTKREGVLVNLVSLQAPGVVVVNYEALDSKKILDLLRKWAPNIVVCDELHLIKTHTSKRSKAAVELGDRATYRFGLTGTAVLNSEMDLYMQWRFLDKGESFGRNITEFRARWCYPVTKRFGMREFTEWNFNADKREQFQSLLSRYAMVVKKEDVLDLPNQEEEIIEVPMSSEQRKAYDQMSKEFLAYVDGAVSTANIALVKGLRLLQIASGHLSVESVEQQDQERSVHVFPENPKIEWLKGWLPEITKEEKVVIWCCFTQNVKDLLQMAQDLGIEAETITGEHTAREKTANNHRFQTDKNVRLMIANRKAGGIGINMTAAAYSVVFSRNFSRGEEEQSDGRTHRGGSEIHERIIKIDLSCANTVESVVREAVKKKKSKSDMLLDLRKAVGQAV